MVEKCKVDNAIDNCVRDWRLRLTPSGDIRSKLCEKGFTHDTASGLAKDILYGDKDSNETESDPDSKPLNIVKLVEPAEVVQSLGKNGSVLSDTPN